MRRARYLRRLASVALVAAAACVERTGPASSTTMDRQSARARMVETQIKARGVTDARVLAAMATTPREAFLPPELASQAYEDTPLPIGHGQTISQPYIVALMTELARPQPTDRALEVGTGSGYQAAILARLVSHVWTIELVEPLGREAAARLRTLPNVTTRIGDGYAGWPEAAPFDIIVVTAAPDVVPPALTAQLAPGGRLVIPVGPTSGVQELRVIEKGRDGALNERDVIPVRFVPLVRPPS